MTDRSASGTAALDKALKIFKRVLADRGRSSINDLLVDLRLAPSTKHRLVKALVEHGLIVRVGVGRYDMRAELFCNADDAPPVANLAAAARPYLQKLAAEMKGTAHLGVLEHEMVTYLVKAVCKNAREIALFTQETQQLEAYCSGIGKVLLAFLPARQLDAYLSGETFVPLTKRTITSPTKLASVLEQVRSVQFAIDDGEASDEICCVAVPVFDARGRVVAAISLTFHRTVEQVAMLPRLVDRMRSIATDIGRIPGKEGMMSSS
jgi:DNA-binding IclR family transcriptional regulator